MPSLLEQAEAAFQAGNIPMAERLTKQALAANPVSVPGTVLLGIICARKGLVPQAILSLENALRFSPDCLEAHIALATVLANSGRIEEAVSHAERAVELDPEDPAVICHLGLLLVSLGRFEEAITRFQRAVEIAPSDLHPARNLAAALTDANREVEAISAWERVTELGPKVLPAWLTLARLRLSHGDLPGAVRDAQRALALNEKSSPAHLLLALALSENREGPKAEKHLAEAIRLSPGDGLAHAAMGFWLQESGRFDDARKSLEKAIELRPEHGFAYYNLMRSRKATPADLPFVERMEEVLSSPTTPIRDRGYLHYALGKSYEDLARFEESMRHYHEANHLAYQIWLAHRPWDREAYAKAFDERIATFSPDFVRRNQPFGVDSDLPVFVVGMIRSGTSLVEQILSSHPEVAGAGELPFWHENEEKIVDLPRGEIDLAELSRSANAYIEQLREFAPKAKRVTDKLPHNYAQLGLIHTACPRARFIHIRRMPLDNALSIYVTAYQRPPVFAHDAENIVFAYREYLRIVEYWRTIIPPELFLEVDYEELVADREGVTRRMIEFCGLEWSDECLQHDRNVREVRTPSLWQVRQPIYNTSIQRWKKFEPWLGALSELDRF